jgi:prephenate dehydrogenase
VDAGAAVPTFERVGLVGVGLIGGSIAAALRARQPTVEITAIDVPNTIERGRARGLIDHATTSPADLRDHDLIILATPIAAIIELLRRGELSGARGVVTDVGSTKRDILAAAARGGVPRFVGGHPMAGSERRGVDHADPDLFVNRPWLVVSTDDDSPDVGEVSRWTADLGAVPALVDAAVHDRTVAYLSHAPQLIAVALMRAAAESLDSDQLRWAGRAFRDMTRIAASDFPMWRDILATNADNIEPALHHVAALLPRGSGLTDTAVLQNAFEQARHARASLDRPGT